MRFRLFPKRGSDQRSDMRRCWSAKFFLKFLNRYTVKEFVFTQEVDVVIV